jgi:hypothetical protein
MCQCGWQHTEGALLLLLLVVLVLLRYARMVVRGIRARLQKGHAVQAHFARETCYTSAQPIGAHGTNRLEPASWTWKPA